MKIWELNEDEIIRVEQRLMVARANHMRVRVAMDGGLKVKIGEQMWSPPLASLA